MWFFFNSWTINLQYYRIWLKRKIFLCQIWNYSRIGTVCWSILQLMSNSNCFQGKIGTIVSPFVQPRRRWRWNRRLRRWVKLRRRVRSWGIILPRLSSGVKKWCIGDCKWTLFINKRFALNEMFQRNTSKFAIFYV